jgi:WD40 repeat protein
MTLHTHLRSLIRGLIAPVALFALLAAAAAPADAAFPGHDGPVVFSWFSFSESELAPFPSRTESAIKLVEPGVGEVPTTLRGCTRATGEADVGDCSIGYASPAVAPNGALIAFDAGASLALMRIDGSRLRLLPAHAADDSQPTFSPDGRGLAFSSGPVDSVHRPLARGIRTSDLAGHTVRQVTARGLAPAWSTRGWIAFLRRDGVYRVRPDGRGLRSAVVRHRCTDVAWSPRGAKLAFTCSGRLLIADADGTHLRRVPGTSSAQSVAWSPSGRFLLVGIFDAGVVTMRPDGRPGPVLEGAGGGAGATHVFGAGSADWAPAR